MVEKKTDTLNMRVNADDMRKFKIICKTRYRMKYTHMLGDIIKAFVEGRMKITPTKAQQQLFTEGE